MKKDYTHICFVLDSSGSMDFIKEDTQGTFNNFIDEQKKALGKTTFDLFCFANGTSRIVHFIDLAENRKDFMTDYHCSGGTALYDAVCEAIDSVGQDLARIPEPERPEHVLVAILTDGEENSSRKFSCQDVKNRIRHQTEVYSWNFVFLGANIDVVQNGQKLGLQEQDCVKFEASAEGISNVMMCIMSERMDNIRNRKK